jgi:LuxR family maltose regulon positive regulatory protein
LRGGVGGVLLVRVQGVELDDAGVALIVERTEGWPAGLALASLWLRDLDDPATGVRRVGGGQQQVASYLASEVLAAVDRDLRSFLLRTSVLGRFTAAMADAVLGRRDSAAMLAEAERANLFLVGPDQPAGWFRYRRFFTDLLRRELARTEPAAAAELHRRAAAWCAGEGLVAEAVEHAAEAGDRAALATVLAEHHRALLASGRELALLQGVERLPQEMLLSRPELAASGALAALLLARPAPERSRLARIADRARDERPGAWTPYVEGLLALVRATAIDGDLREAVRRGRRAAELGRLPGAEAAGTAALTVGALAALAYSLYLIGDLADAHNRAREAVDRPDVARRPRGLILSLGVLALTEVEAGRMREGAAVARRAIATALSRDLADSWWTAPAYLALAAALAAGGRLEEAEREAARAERLRPQPGASIPHAHALLVLARLRVARGDVNRASRDVRTARREVMGFTGPGRLTALLADVELTLDQARRESRAEAPARPSAGGRASLAAPVHVSARQVSPPSLPANLVMRQRLHEQLTAGTTNVVTLVAAQPGAGKTFLVASWAAGGQAPGPVAWMSLEPGDDAPGAFWQLMASALEQAAGISVEVAPTGLAPMLVADAVAALGTPLVVVLDDFQLLRSPPLLDEVESLIAMAPPQLRLVLVSRSDPPLSLHRLRLQGSLTELRTGDLAFTTGEARALLGEDGEGLGEDDLALLVRRTEGWAAGLRFAALSLRRHPSPRRFVDDFAGSDRAIADYLMGEVLDGQEPDVRRFLLRTSVPELVTADLAALLSGRADAARLLDGLARANAFVVRERNGEEVFRFHQLFREFLRAEFRRTYPEELTALQRTAASWLAAHGQPVLAIRHAIAGRDWPGAAELVARHWNDVLAGGGAGVLRHVDPSLRAEAATREPELALLAAVDQLGHGDPEAGWRLLDHADALGGRAVGPDREPGFGVLRWFARLHFDQASGDFGGVARAAEALLAESPSGPPTGSRVPAVRATVQASLASVAFAGGDLEAAEGLWEAALETASQGGMEHQELGAMGGLALVAAAGGRLRRAAEIGSDAVAQAKARGRSEALESVGAQQALGWVHLHRDELDRAVVWLESAGALSRTFDSVPGRVLSAVLEARVLGARGPAGAAEGLRRLRAAWDDQRALRRGPFYRSLALGLEARLLVARGDGLEVALASLDREEQEEEEAPERPELAIVRARLLILAGRPAEALDRLAASSPPPPSHLALLIESLTLRALAFQDTGERGRGHAALGQALELGAAEGYRRVFLDGGAPLAALLREHFRFSPGQRAYAMELIAAFDERAPAVKAGRLELPEPLSERERAVLRCLPTMMSNTEIARTLYLSVNTVKTHLRHVYGKLGASGRREAVERGRALKLL